MAKTTLRVARQRRHFRVRKKIAGTSQRLRLSVFRSLRHIYAQVVDDLTGHTLASASTLSPEILKNNSQKVKTEKARLVGSLIGQRALQKGIKQVVFDRGGYKYHGRVKALAEAARQAGLEF